MSATASKPPSNDGSRVRQMAEQETGHIIDYLRDEVTPPVSFVLSKEIAHMIQTAIELVATTSQAIGRREGMEEVRDLCSSMLLYLETLPHLQTLEEVEAASAHKAVLVERLKAALRTAAAQEGRG